MELNFVLQGKGGVGKTAIAAYLTQYLAKDREVLSIDADSNNPSYSAFKAFDAKPIFLAYGDEVNQRAFDQLIEEIAASTAEAAVIDVGSSSFGALCSYIRTNEIISLLDGMGHSVRFHVVITGGASQSDTVNSFAVLAEYFPDVEMVIWSNGYFGEPGRNGKTFEQSLVYEKNKHRIFAYITLPELKKETFGFDLEAMMTARQTFDERINGPETNIVAKQRLKMVWRDLTDQLTGARV